MGGAFRGYGAPQVTFARESQIDRIASELKIDPVEIRLKNCFTQGEIQPTGHKIPSVNIKDTIIRAKEMIGWGREERNKNRSLGIACGFTPCGGLATSCILRINQDGTVNVNSGAVDMGQGLKTVLTQIVAEELGIPIENILLISGDTDSTYFDVGVFSDRGTHTAGLAAKMAAMDAKRQIFEIASEELEANIDDLYLRNGKVFIKGSPEHFISISDLISRNIFRKGRPIIGKASINPDTPSVDINKVRGATSKLPSTYTFATTAVEVEVDRISGRIKVVKAFGVNDCGTVINPDGAEGQMDGGMAIGLGYGLFEEILMEDGQVLNPNFLEYRLPTALDMPDFSRATVENYDENGPFGAKGIGNSSVINMAPAIANAIYRATGIMIKELPITPEKILRCLQKNP